MEPQAADQDEIRYRLHGPWIYALILAMVQDVSLAELLTFEVFWQACARRLRPDDDRVWLRLAARRLTILALRTPDWTPAHPATFRAACRVTAVDLHEVWRILNAAPRHEREAFELAYFEGLSHSEIAALIGRSLGTVKTWVRSARLRSEGSRSLAACSSSG
jgi:RNA polymerase sigma-70 factor (ECF subfamily)